MKAVYASTVNHDDPLAALAVGEQPEPQARPFWSTVSVRAVTVNHHDVWSLQGVGLAAEQTPMILGTDASGVLDEDIPVRKGLKAGAEVVLYTFVGISLGLGLGILLGRKLKLNRDTTLLISVGTSICGGSAIAAIAPVIEATDMDIAYGMSATFLFDTIMVVVFPLLGRAMGLSDAAFGLWAGTAVNDTSSVVATGYAFSEAAGDFATMVKLTRTLAIIPTVLVFAAISIRLKQKAAAQSGDHGVKVNMKSVFPWFILGFLAMSILCSVGVIPAGLAATLKSISKFLMVAALAAIGLNTNFAALCKSGAKPMLHGFIISLLVVLVAIGVEYMLGIAPYGTLV